MHETCFSPIERPLARRLTTQIRTIRFTLCCVNLLQRPGGGITQPRTTFKGHLCTRAFSFALLEGVILRWQFNNNVALYFPLFGQFRLNHAVVRKSAVAVAHFAKRMCGEGIRTSVKHNITKKSTCMHIYIKQLLVGW